MCEPLDMEHPLRTYRRERDITLDQLAKEAGLSKSHLSEIETGKRPGSKTIELLCAKTGLSPAVFFAPSVLPAPAGFEVAGDPRDMPSLGVSSLDCPARASAVSGAISEDAA